MVFQGLNGDAIFLYYILSPHSMKINIVFIEKNLVYPLFLQTEFMYIVGPMMSSQRREVMTLSSTILYSLNPKIWHANCQSQKLYRN
jgi:hypothetical protein